MYQITLITELSRVEKLRLSLDRAGVAIPDIAEDLNVTTNTVRRLLFNATIPPFRHEQLVALGIPAELLPAPEYIVPGPKPRDCEALAEAA